MRRNARREEIERLARPGETWDEAEQRISQLKAALDTNVVQLPGTQRQVEGRSSKPINASKQMPMSRMAGLVVDNDKPVNARNVSTKVPSVYPEKNVPAPLEEVSNEEAGLWQQVDSQHKCRANARALTNNLPIKDDYASMSLPIFTVQTKKPDLIPREYIRSDNKIVRIRPTYIGSATILDKDLLLYAASLITEARNRKEEVTRTLEVNGKDFLAFARRGDGRMSYDAINSMLLRLRGTTIETDIETGGIRQVKGFSLLDSYEILAKKQHNGVDPRDKKTPRVFTSVLRFRFTLSEWLFNSLEATEVLTLAPDYFNISRPIERRLYEIARRHCGKQSIWKVSIDVLHRQVGTTRELFKFRDELRGSIMDDRLPEYHIALDSKTKPNVVVFYTRNEAVLHKELTRTKGLDWFQSLERPGYCCKGGKPEATPDKVEHD